jgi:putative serine protease PepD
MNAPESEPTSASDPSVPPSERRRAGTNQGMWAAVFTAGLLSGALLGIAASGFVPSLPVANALAKAELGPASAAPVAPPTEGQPFRRVAQAAFAVTASIAGSGAYGAGIVIDEHHVLTCLHVVNDMEAIEVSIADGPPQPASVVDKDTALDLAVLRYDRAHPVFARLASVVSVEMGDRAFAMGAPRKLGFSLGSGVVSYAGRLYSELYYLQTDLATNSGSSGGPVLDAQGQVIAISSFILRDSQGLTFALPIDYAVRRFPSRFRERLDPAPFARWLAERAERGPKATAARSASP